MKLKYLFLLLCGGIICSAFSTNAQVKKSFRRPSMCNFIVVHPEEKYLDSITPILKDARIPETYDDHNLSVRVINWDGEKYDLVLQKFGKPKGLNLDSLAQTMEIVPDPKLPIEKMSVLRVNTDMFLSNNHIASRLVDQWFNRNPYTGVCNMDRVNAAVGLSTQAADIDMSNRLSGGIGRVQDQVQKDLLGRTFVLVNEIHVIDHSNRGKTWGLITGLAMTALAVATSSDGKISQSTQDDIAATTNLISSWKKCALKVRTQLYQLVWDDPEIEFFYNCYSDSTDYAKARFFEENRNKFRLNYLGMAESKGGKTSFGDQEVSAVTLIKAATFRAIEDNIVDLQREFPQFRVVSPIEKVQDNMVYVPIGTREGVNSDSKYEVVEPEVKEDGTVTYKHICNLKPKSNEIWNNKFEAANVDGTDKNTKLTATTFIKQGGGEISDMMMVREVYKK